MSAISFTAYGTPAPKGSTRAFVPKGWKRAIVTEDNKHTRPWAAIVQDAAIMAGGGAGTAIEFQKGSPVRLEIRFIMPRPKSLPKRVRRHVKKPDLDKLVRAVKDALTGVTWVDDSQVVQVEAEKQYAINGEMPRAEISVVGVPF